MSVSTSRRSFFKKVVLGSLVLPFVRLADVYAEACAAPTTDKVKKKLLDYTGKTAKRLDFVADASAASKHAKFVKGSNCGNCKFNKADKVEPTYGRCTMAANKYVPKCGWCKTYKAVKKKA